MSPRRLQRLMLFGLFAANAASLSLASDGKPSDAEIRFFETQVRPVLAQHCYKCHGQRKQEGGLRLDTAAGLQTGGDSGSVVVPGQPSQSLLVTAVSHADADLRMPPDRKLSPQHIANLTHWVKIGAPHPDGALAGGVKPQPVDIERGRQFWSFQPPLDPPVPPVRNSGWAASPLDRFVLAPLEAGNVSPSPPADRRTLIRRATFDLIGLPPAPDEVEAFVADDSPDAFAKVVDRLLASPHYGERWGRHWLDVVRYADSNGLDENVAHGNAWRFRDYIVDSFNRDKPYSDLVLEQLAGDSLPSDDLAIRHERLIATGFLSLGPKVLAEVDERKMEMDIVDEQIDTLGRAFMALTFGCSRCHDHKFDPLPTTDYYALSGIFKSTRTMEHFKKVARWWEHSIATPLESERQAEHEKLVAGRKAEIEAFVKQASQRLLEAAPNAALPSNPEQHYSDETRAELKRLRDELARLTAAAPELPTAMGVTDAEQVADVAVHVRGSHLTLGELAPRRVPQVLAGPDAPVFPSNHSGRLELARWLVRPDHPLTSRVMVNRMWRWHFGRGLVASTDNFGVQGDRPTNPPLLDWLAQRFVAGGWSLKHTHRLMMLSETYRMSSQFDAHAAQVDPDNRLLGRRDVLRLEVEAIRDSLLLVGDLLDDAMGGKLLPVKNRDYIFDHTSRDLTNYDINRRAVYLPVIRNNLYDVFQLFDFTDASTMNGSRATTTVAPQALFVMNSELVAKVTDSLARSLLQRTDLDDPERIRILYARAYGRAPTEHEVERGLRFVNESESSSSGSPDDPTSRRQRAWQLLCHAVVAANEFVFVR